MLRYLGIDYGRRRIGLAVGEAATKIVSPSKSVRASGDLQRDAEAVLQAAQAYHVDEFVIGLPLNMDGTEGEQARVSRRFAEVLGARGGRPVHLFDERLSSFAADELLNRRDLTRKKRRARRDALAAQCMLEAFLTAQTDR